jgi:hypothetical protein
MYSSEFLFSALRLADPKQLTSNATPLPFSPHLQSPIQNSALIP